MRCARRRRSAARTFIAAAPKPFSGVGRVRGPLLPEGRKKQGKSKRVRPALYLTLSQRERDGQWRRACQCASTLPSPGGRGPWRPRSRWPMRSGDWTCRSGYEAVAAGGTMRPRTCRVRPWPWLKWSVGSPGVLNDAAVVPDLRAAVAAPAKRGDASHRQQSKHRAGPSTNTGSARLSPGTGGSGRGNSVAPDNRTD